MQIYFCKVKKAVSPYSNLTVEKSLPRKVFIITSEEIDFPNFKRSGIVPSKFPILLSVILRIVS
jgi:hypothetical protein